jgi:hypothetical protein
MTRVLRVTGVDLLDPSAIENLDPELRKDALTKLQLLQSNVSTIMERLQKSD